MAETPMWKKALLCIGLLAVVGIALGVGLGIGLPKSSSNSNSGGTAASSALPLVKPLVEQASAAVFVAADSGRLRQRVLNDPGFQPLSSSIVVSRFFQPGPAYIWGILQNIDDRLKFYTAAKRASMPCAQSTAVSKSIAMFGGETVTFYAQCYDAFGDGSGGVQFGVYQENIYLVQYGGVGPFYARIANYSNVTDSATAVDIWMAVGAYPEPSPRNGTYITTRIHAAPGQKRFEMTVAGLGTGFCGVQIVSTATVVNATGSQDPCHPTETICFSSLDSTQSATCTTDANRFDLTPLGRLSGVYGPSPPGSNQPFTESYYPGTGLNNIKVSGATDDSVYFGVDHWGSTQTS